MPSPSLTEIATTTLRNRRTKMPSHSEKQAKTMSAIAHGWEPTGGAAGIPKKVAKEFHAADKGKKYGKGHDKGGHGHAEFRAPHHSPAGIANNDGFAGKTEGRTAGKHSMASHDKQPHGKSIGNAPEFARHRPNQSFEAEVREHEGAGHRSAVANIGKGGSMGKHHGEVAHTGPADRGSHLVEETNEGHHDQPGGRGIGAGMGAGGAAHHKGSTMGGAAHSFRPPPATGAHGYGHSNRSGPLRMSGHPGAHRIGSRGK